MLKLQPGDSVTYLPTENFVTGEKIESGEYNIMGRAVREYWLNNEEYYNWINIFLVMPKENMENLFGSSYLVQVWANADDEHIRDLGEWLNENSSRYDFSVTDNVEELFEQHDKNMIVFIGLLLVSIFIIITGIVCVYHIIVTGISERKTDFKILNMVGMSSAQFRWMLLIEDIFYGICSVIVGAELFIVFSSLSMFQSMGINFDYSMTGIFMLVSFLIITCTGAISGASGIKTAA